MEKIVEKPKPPIEGIIYGETAAIITIIGICIAIAGIVVGVTSGNDIVDFQKLVNDLLSGKSEYYIWNHDSKLGDLQHTKYWFFNMLNYGTGIAMTGIAIAIFGGIVGALGIFISMFRSKEVLLYKKGLYTILSLVIVLILILAAAGVISLRH